MPKLAIRAEPPFVGESRQAALTEVDAVYRRVVTRGEAHLVLLAGDAGDGKTRIIREFYLSLAAAQDSPAYWPRTLVKETSPNADSRAIQEHLRRSRHIIAPERPHLWPANAVPNWLWLPIHGEIDSSGMPVSTMSTLEREIAPHLPAIWARFLADHHGMGPDAQRQLLALLKDEVPIDSFSEAVQRIVELSSGIPLPLLPVALKALQRTVHGVRVAHEIRRELRTDTVLKDPYGETRASTLELAAGLRRIAKSGIPIIVVLDNLEFHHPGFYNMLDELLPATRDNDASILFVAAMSRIALRQWKSPLPEALAWLEDRHRLTLHELPPMDDELDNLFPLIAPKTTRATRSLVRQHHPTPLRLWGFLNSPDAQDHIRDYQLDVDEEVLHREPLPSDVTRMRPWISLSVLDQDILALLSVASWRGQGLGDLIICPRIVLSSVARTLLSGVEADEIERVIAEAPEIVRLADGTLSYADATIGDLAIAEGKRRYASSSIMIRSTIIETVTQLVMDEKSEGYLMAVKYFSAYAAMGLINDEAAAEEVHVQRLLNAESLSDYEDVELVLGILKKIGWPSEPDLARVAKEAVFNYMIERQRVNEAFELGIQLINDGLVSDPTESRENLDFAITMAHLVALNGQPELSVEMLENILARIKESGLDDLRSSAESCLGLWLTETNRPAESVVLLAKTVESLSETERHSGHGLAIRENYASALALSGNQDEARTLFDGLLPESRAYRGASSPVHLRLEHNRLVRLTTALSLEQRIDGFAELLQRRLNLFGFDEGSLSTWVALLNTLGQSNDHMAVINTAEAFLAEFTRKFSELHEAIVNVVLLVGWNLVHAGRSTEAEVWARDAFRRVGLCRLPHPWQIRASTLLVSRCCLDRNDWYAAMRTLLPLRLELSLRNEPSLEFVDTWVRLALCLGDNGQHASAGQELDSLLGWPELSALLPRDMQARLHDRAGSSMLEASLDHAESYWLEKAIYHFEQSAVMAERLALPDEAFRAKRNNMTALRRMGRADEAVDLGRRLLTSEIVPKVRRDIREELLYCYLDGNRLREAIILGEELMREDSSSLYRTEDEALRATLKIRHNVAACRYLSGDVARARDEMQAAAEERERAFGADDEETIQSRQQLAVIEGTAKAAGG